MGISMQKRNVLGASITPSELTFGAFKSSVVNTTTANITLSAEQTLDGILTATSRILVKDQTDASENGIYVTAAGAWTRATDADDADKMTSGIMVVVQKGTLNALKIFMLTTVEPIVLDTDNLTFTELGGAVGANALATDSVIAAKILADAVTTVKILNDNVTDAKITSHVSTKITGLPTQTSDLDMGDKNINNAGLISIPAGTTLTLVTGVITVTLPFHGVETQNSDPTDDCTDINLPVLTKVILKSINSARDPTMKDGTPLRLVGDFTMDSSSDWLILFGETATIASELGRSNNL